jgi:predicted RNA-binding Zn-ribbon protein involved in translation (DUF1610 family)
MTNYEQQQPCPRCNGDMRRIETTEVAPTYKCETCGHSRKESCSTRYDFDKVRDALVGKRITGADDVRGLPAVQIERGYEVVVSDTVRTWVEQSGAFQCPVCGYRDRHAVSARPDDESPRPTSLPSKVYRCADCGCTFPDHTVE